MRLHRFFSREKIQQNNAGLITQTTATAQWRRVFRFGQGDRVILFDGSGNDFICEIQEYKDGNGNEEGETVLKIIEVAKNNAKPRFNVSLYAAVVKKDIFEWIAEKATELGVSDIVPVIAERSEKKNLNAERLEKIAVEASEQSGRGTVPAIRPVSEFSDAIADVVKRKQPGIVFDPSGIKFSEKDFVNFSADASVAVFIGPEGGWSPDELTAFKQAGIPALSLGPQILRAETAVVAALSRLVF
jgi:16S rRNA (uracil1498-N3)-methyltransferase